MISLDDHCLVLSQGLHGCQRTDSVFFSLFLLRMVLFIGSKWLLCALLASKLNINTQPTVNLLTQWYNTTKLCQKLPLPAMCVPHYLLFVTYYKVFSTSSCAHCARRGRRHRTGFFLKCNHPQCKQGTLPAAGWFSAGLDLELFSLVAMQWRSEGSYQMALLDLMESRRQWAGIRERQMRDYAGRFTPQWSKLQYPCGIISYNRAVCFIISQYTSVRVKNS